MIRVPLVIPALAPALILVLRPISTRVALLLLLRVVRPFRRPAIGGSRARMIGFAHGGRALLLLLGSGALPSLLHLLGSRARPVKPGLVSLTTRPLLSAWLCGYRSAVVRLPARIRAGGILRMVVVVLLL